MASQNFALSSTRTVDNVKHCSYREYYGELHTEEQAATAPKEVKQGRFIRVFFCATDGEKVPVEIASSGTVTQLRVSVLYSHILSNFSLSRTSERLSCALFCVCIFFLWLLAARRSCQLVSHEPELWVPRRLC